MKNTIPPAIEGAVACTVRLETTVGIIDIIVRPDRAPHGTRRFLELAAAGDLHELAFYRAIEGCIVQFGLPAKRPWPPIPNDPPTGVPFSLGAVGFAAVGENSRKSTLFICIGFLLSFFYPDRFQLFTQHFLLFYRKASKTITQKPLDTLRVEESNSARKVLHV